MIELSVKDYEEKIQKVIKDIETLRMTGESGRKLDVLCEYKEYLKDELDLLKISLREKNHKH